MSTVRRQERRPEIDNYAFRRETKQNNQNAERLYQVNFQLFWEV